MAADREIFGQVNVKLNGNENISLCAQLIAYYCGYYLLKSEC